MNRYVIWALIVLLWIGVFAYRIYGDMGMGMEMGMSDTGTGPAGAYAFVDSAGSYFKDSAGNYFIGAGP